MKTYLFKPAFSCVQTFQGVRTIKELEQEVGVYSATPDFIRNNCGPIANEILELIPGWYYDLAKYLGLFVNCDIRIHRLYPSDYPAYPGWHCDGEFRETYFSQPDLDRIKTHEHLIATVSSHELGISNTQFLAEEFEYTSDEESPSHNLWQEINNKLNEKQEKKVFDTRDGQLIKFDAWTLHRAMPASIRGWRLFFRMSMWHRPNLGAGGMITKQEQVYKYFGDAGW